jgi:hypothetical protein
MAMNSWLRHQKNREQKQKIDKRGYIKTETLLTAKETNYQSKEATYRMGENAYKP